MIAISNKRRQNLEECHWVIFRWKHETQEMMNWYRKTHVLEATKHMETNYYSMLFGGQIHGQKKIKLKGVNLILSLTSK